MNVRKVNQVKNLAVPLAVVLIAAFAIFRHIISNNIISDFQAHIQSSIDIVEGQSTYPGHFLFVLLIQFFSFFSSDLIILGYVSCIILAFAVSYKFTISLRYFLSIADENVEQRFNKMNFFWMTSILCMLLLFANMIPSYNYLDLSSNQNWLTNLKFYPGKIPLNYWHNSTSILVMPFVLLLFFKSYEYLQKPSTRLILEITLLCLLNIYAKPSYYLVFALAFPLFLFYKFRFTKATFWILPVLILSGVSLLIQPHQYYEIGSGNVGEIQYRIDFLNVWSSFSDSILRDIFLSILFPISFLIVYFKTIKKNELIQYVLITFIISILVFAVFSETGRQEFHGNFSWQAGLCNYLLFLVCLVEWIRIKINKHEFKYVDYFLAFIIFAHIISGFLYLYKMFTFLISWGI